MGELANFRQFLLKRLPRIAAQAGEIARLRQEQAELMAAKDAAERANAAKSEYLAKISQELRLSLNAMLSYCDALLVNADFDGHSQHIAGLKKISAAGKHGLAMVSDILDISRIEAGTMRLYVESVSLNTLVDELEASARPMVAANANVLVVERGADLGVIETDPVKLRQAILSLLSHAAKATRNGTVRLSVRQAGNEVEVEVADSGIGAAAEQQVLASLFVEEAPGHNDSGLGLALIRDLCWLLCGSMVVDSDPQRGSRYTLRLPSKVAQLVTVEPSLPVLHRGPSPDEQAFLDEIDAETSEPAVASVQAGGYIHARERLLVVDDDRSVLEQAERVFFDEGYVPICTDAPQSALQIARTVRPAAIFLDVAMPGFDGWDVLAALKSDPDTAGIPVFMISSLSERSRALEAGAVGVVMTPLDAATIKAAITGFKAARGVGRPVGRAIGR